MARWCRLGDLSEALLCILEINTLTIYGTSGEVVPIPIPRTVTSIWPLPFGVLLQQGNEENLPSHLHLSSPILHDISHSKQESGHSPQHGFRLRNSMGHMVKIDGALMSSHLILKDSKEEPQPTFVEERGKLNLMRDIDEKTIWTSDCIPLMASYNKGKMQHSVWVVEVIKSNIELENGSFSIPAGVLPKQFSFRRIWQVKGAQSAASKVFLATDADSVPVICLLFQEQKKLLSVRLQSVKINDQVVFDIKTNMSWSIAAIAAAPVTVTRPRVKLGLLPFTDIIVLAPDNTLLLYSGNQCLCRYSLPSCLGINEGQLSHNPESSEMAYNLGDLKMVGLADFVDGRINVILKNGKMFRCALLKSPSSSLVCDCIIAMAEGLSSDFYLRFLVLLWGDSDSSYPSKAESGVDSEWESFSNIMLEMCRKVGQAFEMPPASVSNSSWEFLVKSEFHKKNYCQLNFATGVSCGVSRYFQEADSSKSSSVAMQTAEKSFYSELLLESLESLHAVYETLKLDNLRKRDLVLMVPLLCNVAKSLGKESYLDHYIRDFPTLSKKFGISGISSTLRGPPSLFRWLETCLQHGCSSADINDLPTLILKDGSSVTRYGRKMVSFYSILFGAKQVGKKLSSGVYCNIAPGSFHNCEELTVLAMAGERFGLQQLDLLPTGISLPLRHALDKCREFPPTDWPAAAYVLLGREDLALSGFSHSSKYRDIQIGENVNLTSVSTPYMLHLHPVTIPSTVSDTIGLDNTKFEDTDSVDGSLNDGMEHIFNFSTQLRYGQDSRLNEVRRLLCSATPVAIQTSVNPTASDQDEQQAQLWQLAQRTTALPLGRGAFTLATTSTLLTEAFTVPKLVLAGRLPAQQNATVNLDPNVRNIQELKSWPEFHNAVAAGLRLAQLQGNMSKTWIVYNKPEEPNGVHAGLLLALGLNGLLRVLSLTQIFTYLTQEHESTTVGLLLGLAASYRGTMESDISKAINFHIPSRNSSCFSELELPSLVQSAALVSQGILYEGSAQLDIMQTLMVELGRRSGGDNVLEREGYAVSAGFGLGLTALGRGEDALGFMDRLVNRLLQYVGGEEFHCQERSHLLTQSTDDFDCVAGQHTNGTPINFDVTAPGAIIALTLIYLKTESEVMVSKLSVPCTRYELQFVRPDFIMLRVIARNLIMWRRVQPSRDWVQSQVPEIVYDGVRSICDEVDDVDIMDAEAFVQAYVNIVTGTCISLGLRFAGTKDGNAQELLYDYAIYILNEIKPVSATRGYNLPKGLSGYVDRGTLEICLHLIVLSLSVVMAGSGHLQTFKLLRFLRNRSSADGHANYGTQMAVSLAMGFLFLGGGMRTFSTSNISIAALLITLYPRLPTGPNDNRCHLQAFRHLYVLASEARWVQTVDVDTGLPVYAPLDITIKETENYSETSFCEVTPCVLPERSILKTVRVCGPRYWPQVIELVPENKPWWSFGERNDPFNSGILYIKRKVGACSYIDDPVGCQSLLSRAMHKVFGLTKHRCGDTSNGPGSATVDQLVSTFSSDPSLIAFAQLFCDPSWNSKSDLVFQEFCLQVLFECISKDRPPLLQVYLSLYTTIGSMADLVYSGTTALGDSLLISSLKLALAYNEALLSGRLTTLKGGIVQSTFLGSLRKRVEVLLNHSQELKDDFHNYLSSGSWPSDYSESNQRSILLSWYLQWFCVPPAAVVKTAVERIKSRVSSPSSLSLLHLLLPKTHITAISEIDKFRLHMNTQKGSERAASLPFSPTWEMP